MNETIFDRISLLVNKLCEGKNTVLASITGVNEANIRNYRNGVMPKADFLEKIVRKFDINPFWLLTGEGSMLREEKKSEEIKLEKHETVQSKPDDSVLLGLFQSLQEEKKRLVEEKEKKIEKLTEELRAMERKVGSLEAELKHAATLGYRTAENASTRKPSSQSKVSAHFVSAPSND